jgi:hypothetical protein
MAEAPVVVDEVNVGVADPAVRNSDFNFVCLQFARLVFVWNQLRARGINRQTVDLIGGDWNR